MKNLNIKKLLLELLKGASNNIWVGDYDTRAKQINSGLTSSSGIDVWLKAVLTALCQDYPGQTGVIFRGRLTPNSRGYFEICIYNTSMVSGGLPQYSFGTWRQWQNTFWIISTNAYAFSYVAK